MKKHKKTGGPAATGGPVTAAERKPRAESAPAAKVAGPATSVPEAKPAKADTAPAPETKPVKAGAAPVPGAEPAKADAAPAPETKPVKADAVPAPGAEPAKADAVPAPGAEPAKADAAPAPETKPAKADTAPAPGAEHAKAGAAPAPETKSAKAAAAPVPETKPAKANRRKALRRAGRAARALCRGAWWENPVLARGLALAPILGAAFTLKNGILLAGAMGMTVLLESALALPIQRLLPRSLRPAALFAAAAAVTVPVELLSGAFAPTAAALCGIYLPLLPVCALPLAGQDAGRSHDGARVLFLALRDGLGFALAAVLLSAVREIAGLGTLYDRPLPGGAQFKFSFTQSPAGAFILLGCVLALFTAFARRRKGGERR